MSLDVISNPISFQTSLDPSRPLVLPDHSRLYHMTSRSRALHPLQTNKILSYLCPANPNSSQSLSSLLSYNTPLLSVLSFQTLPPLHCGPNLLQLGYVPLLALYQVPEGPSDFLVLLYEFLECLFNGTQNPAISGDHGWGVGVSVEYTLLLEGNAPSTCKRSAMKEKIIRKIIISIIKNTHLEECTRQSCMVLTHLSQRLAPPIFTAAPPWYFTGCFPLAFLEGRCLFSSPAATSLCLDPVIQDLSAPSKRVASSSSILSQSHQIYFNFSFSSAILCFSASSLALASTLLLVF